LIIVPKIVTVSVAPEGAIEPPAAVGRVGIALDLDYASVLDEDVLGAAKKYLRNDKRAIVFRKPTNVAKEAA